MIDSICSVLQGTTPMQNNTPNILSENSFTLRFRTPQAFESEKCWLCRLETWRCFARFSKFVSSRSWSRIIWKLPCLSKRQLSRYCSCEKLGDLPAFLSVFPNRMANAHMISLGEHRLERSGFLYYRLAWYATSILCHSVECWFLQARQTFNRRLRICRQNFSPPSSRKKYRKRGVMAVLNWFVTLGR